jgi:uncharacterized glyoxalase superfamily protein PhnB
MTHVVDIACTIAFYEQLGAKLGGTHRNPQGQLVWASMMAGDSFFMFSLASGPIIAEQQAVLFYLYSANLVALREQMVARGIEVSPITHPFYMEKGEMRAQDPDGYVLLIGQTG